MQKTIPADYIGNEAFGYIILALPSENAKKHIAGLLNNLAIELPGVLWPMPSEQLHITLCEITPPKIHVQDAEEMYNLHAEQYEQISRQVLSTIPKFTISIDAVEAFPEAIIVRSNDSREFNSIRAKLTDALPIPLNTRKPPHIVHSSVARYLKSFELERVQQVVARHSVTIKEEVSAFKLLRYEVLPLQKYKVIETFTLEV